ncbi:MAG: 2,3-bisphosphoglycerate-independent phosphoglycerate mutase [Thermoleophilia bacterium]|nr:2,3-bisphosphoglycerate-independent phosphoglycerate mutase [Thermoleophilia bacterium]MDH3724156.1 2,3-bisphosphoglycerate-independent phosphoglycerate mutase [Thermoleophilia bacterium]
MDLTPLLTASDAKIVVLLLDGLGGYADAHGGTELEDADTPNLDALAEEGSSGLAEIVGPGITPGSGPGHLALFGYDPLEFELGRGALSAAGLDVELRAGDVAARANLCTLDEAGNITDRRAGRIPSPEAAPLVDRIQEQVKLDGAELTIRHEREHRAMVMLRGRGLDPRISDTDPQQTGVPPLVPEPLHPSAMRAAGLFAELERQAREILAGERANGILLRGFDTHEEVPSFAHRYGLNAAAIAVYPMYRGISRLLGMDVLRRPEGLADQAALLREAWGDYDYFFVHHKATDAAGEDGDREAKIAAIEAVDRIVPEVMALNPDVVMVTGDHATPPQMSAHSWHPVPVLLWSERGGRDGVGRFGEGFARSGMLGRRRMSEMMPILLACAGRLKKYGA